jgi:superfamily I DNA/RNA helicase
MNFTPTPEQAAIIEEARRTQDNLIVKALAGAAKTSTLVLIAKALHSTPMLCLAFNKRIAEEMKERLPGNCEAMTLNSLGHRVWMKVIGHGVKLDVKKNYGILKGVVDNLSGKEKEAAYASFSDILKAVELGKSSGYLPTGRFSIAKGLLNDDEFFESLDEEPTSLEQRLIREVTIRSIDLALKGMIDFSDQIFMPTIFPMASFPQYPCVLADEFQDFSSLNFALLKKLVRKRLIAVGDECQSIYGFRGAHGQAMSEGENRFNMTPLVLSVSFRCPQAVVQEARWRAPHMQWPEWAKPGTVTRKTEWGPEDLPDTATILCRNNAPIFSMAIKLLKAGRFPQVVGANDIGANLIKVLKKLGPLGMKQEMVFAAIASWRDEKLKKSRNESKVYDQVDCLTIFAEQGPTLGDAIAYAEHIMTAKGYILLMTGHKSKGLEFDDVFILDRHLVRMDEEQDRNLMYVMQTRSKSSLTYVTSDGWDDEASVHDKPGALSTPASEFDDAIPF